MRNLKPIGRWVPMTGARWRAHCLMAAGVAALALWWTVGWYLTLGWKRALVGAILGFLPLIRWAIFVTKRTGIDVTYFACSVGVVLVASTIVGTSLLVAGLVNGTESVFSVVALVTIVYLGLMAEVAAIAFTFDDDLEDTAVEPAKAGQREQREEFSR